MKPGRSAVVNDARSRGFETRAIGVISPYNGQVQELNRLFEQASGREVGQLFSLEIKSVDRYQGRKRTLSCSPLFGPTRRGWVPFRLPSAERGHHSGKAWADCFGSSNHVATRPNMAILP